MPGGGWGAEAAGEVTAELLAATMALKGALMGVDEVAPEAAVKADAGGEDGNEDTADPDTGEAGTLLTTLLVLFLSELLLLLLFEFATALELELGPAIVGLMTWLVGGLVARDIATEAAAGTAEEVELVCCNNDGGGGWNSHSEVRIAQKTEKIQSEYSTCWEAAIELELETAVGVITAWAEAACKGLLTVLEVDWDPTLLSSLDDLCLRFVSTLMSFEVVMSLEWLCDVYEGTGELAELVDMVSEASTEFVLCSFAPICK